MPFGMATAGEQIAKLERQLEKLRHRAVLELKAKLAEARNRAGELERQIAKLTDSGTDPAQIQPKKARSAIDYRRSQPKPECELSVRHQVAPLPVAQCGNDTDSQKEEARPADPQPKIERLPVGKVSRIISVTRKVGETINIGDDIAIHLTRNDGEVVRFSIDARREIPIFRGELIHQNQRRRFHPSELEIF